MRRLTISDADHGRIVAELRDLKYEQLEQSTTLGRISPVAEAYWLGKASDTHDMIELLNTAETI
jgi:hypothetical protein